MPERVTDSNRTRYSNRLKYRSGSGSRNFIFNGSVQVQDFKNLGSGSVRVHLHQNLKVWVRFGFVETKFLRFRFTKSKS